MKINHIYHSGFVIELESTVLIFDWYSGELPDFDPGKKVFVFVSHGHADHYSPRIWTLRGRYEKICYILDCCTAPEQKGENIFHVQPGRHYRIKNTLVYAIRSNDEGVAYVVSAEGYNFFHAGDLNIWHWKSTAGGQRTERDHRVHERSGVQASVSDALLEPAGRSGRIFKGRKTRSLQGPDLFSQ